MNLYEALPYLEQIVNEEKNPMLILEIMEALTFMRDIRVLEIFKKLSDHEYPIVRLKAKSILREIYNFHID
ncbi:MAG: hypothetical protein ABIL49_00950 [candidate division WOR-3 bacterium]|jgi:hypothetical protein